MRYRVARGRVSNFLSSPFDFTRLRVALWTLPRIFSGWQHVRGEYMGVGTWTQQFCSFFLSAWPKWFVKIPKHQGIIRSPDANGCLLRPPRGRDISDGSFPEHAIFFSRSLATRTRDNLANVASRREYVAVSPGGIPSPVIGPAMGERGHMEPSLIFMGRIWRHAVDPWTRFAEWSFPFFLTPASVCTLSSWVRRTRTVYRCKPRRKPDIDRILRPPRTGRANQAVWRKRPTNTWMDDINRSAILCHRCYLLCVRK